MAVCLLSAALLARAWQARRQAVYLLDFACYKPPADLKVTLPRFMRGSREAQVHPCLLTLLRLSPRLTGPSRL